MSTSFDWYQMDALGALQWKGCASGAGDGRRGIVLGRTFDWVINLNNALQEVQDVAFYLMRRQSYHYGKPEDAERRWRWRWMCRREIGVRS